jgi:putative SOS response-associated peptidase YedK
MHGWKPRYNISPSQMAPIVTDDGPTEARFGLIPPWEKEFSTKFSTINARAETIEKSKLYARLLKNNRCLIPATSFFEWATTDEGKQPMLIKLKTRPLFYFAGLYDTWHKGEKDEHKSFTIITTRPNSFMATIHDRMPVILETEEETPWITEKDYVDFKQVLDSYPNKDMTAYPVSSIVNKPVNDFPEILKEVQTK